MPDGGVTSASEYKTVNDLPFVYRYNLPAPALELFRSVYNETCRQCGPHAATAIAWRDRRRLPR